MPKGNITPKSDNFHAHDFKPISDVPLEKLAERPICIRLEESIDKILRSLPREERINFLRHLITDAVKDKYGNLNY